MIDQKIRKQLPLSQRTKGTMTEEGGSLLFSKKQHLDLKGKDSSLQTKVRNFGEVFFPLKVSTHKYSNR